MKIYVNYGKAGEPTATVLAREVPARMISSERYSLITREDGTRFRVLRSRIRTCFGWYRQYTVGTPRGQVVCDNLKTVSKTIREYVA